MTERVALPLSISRAMPLFLVLFRRLPPQEADDAAFGAGGLGKDFVRQFKAFRA